MRGAPCRDEVIVLGSIKLGETSRIVSCLARDHGRVKLVAKGTRKPGGRWAGLLEPGNELEAVFYARSLGAGRPASPGAGAGEGRGRAGSLFS